MTDFNVFYSAKTNAFYPADLRDRYEHAGSWPDDVIGVPDDMFKEYSVAPPTGKMRTADEDGLPSWVDLPLPSRDELVGEIEQRRASLLAYADSITADWRTELALGEISEDDKDKLSSWMAYKREVKSVKADDALTEGFSWPAHPNN